MKKAGKVTGLVLLFILSLSIVVYNMGIHYRSIWLTHGERMVEYIVLDETLTTDEKRGKMIELYGCEQGNEIADFWLVPMKGGEGE